MDKKKKNAKNSRPKRVELSREEVLKRMHELPQRMEKIVASIRSGNDNNDASESVKVVRPERAQLTPEESLKRMNDLPKRREQMLAAFRKKQNRGISA